MSSKGTSPPLTPLAPRSLQGLLPATGTPAPWGLGGCGTILLDTVLELVGITSPSPLGFFVLFFVFWGVLTGETDLISENEWSCFLGEKTEAFDF